MTNITELTLIKLIEKIKKKELSSKEITKAFILKLFLMKSTTIEIVMVKPMACIERH